jgi:hypothetical protein
VEVEAGGGDAFLLAGQQGQRAGISRGRAGDPALSRAGHYAADRIEEVALAPLVARTGDAHPADPINHGPRECGPYNVRDIT